MKKLAVIVFLSLVACSSDGFVFDDVDPVDASFSTGTQIVPSTWIVYGTYVGVDSETVTCTMYGTEMELFVENLESTPTIPIRPTMDCDELRETDEHWHLMCSDVFYDFFTVDVRFMFDISKEELTGSLAWFNVITGDMYCVFRFDIYDVDVEWVVVER